METSVDPVTLLDKIIPDTPESPSPNKRFKADSGDNEEPVKPTTTEDRRESPTARRTAAREQLKASLLQKSSKPPVKAESAIADFTTAQPAATETLRKIIM